MNRIMTDRVPIVISSTILVLIAAGALINLPFQALLIMVFIGVIATVWMVGAILKADNPITTGFDEQRYQDVAGPRKIGKDRYH